MRHFITGATGFIGNHLIQHLRETRPSDLFYAVGRRPRGPEGVTYFPCELNTPGSLLPILENVRPDRVYHLAGISRITSNQDFSSLFDANFLVVESLLSCLAKLGKPIRCFLASSAHVYGNQNEEVSESTPPRPATAYGFTKFLAEEAGRKTSQSAPLLQVVAGRFYTCIGPNQPEGFVVSDFCRRIAQLPEGAQAMLRTGPLSARRSFLDVRDVAKIVPALLDANHPSTFEIYNIASPHYFTVSEVLKLLLKVAGRTPQIESHEETAPNAFSGLRVNAAKLEGLLHPNFRALEQTLLDTWNATL